MRKVLYLTHFKKTQEIRKPTVRRDLLFFHFVEAKMPQKKLRAPDLWYKAAPLRIPLLESSQDMFPIYAYSLDLSSELGNSSESVHSWYVSHHRISKLKILLVVPWLFGICQKEVSLSNQRTS